MTSSSRGCRHLAAGRSSGVPPKGAIAHSLSITAPAAKTRVNPVSSLVPLLTFTLTLALTSCQSFEPPGATRAEKTAALSAHLHEWKRPVLVNQFARPRTVQLFSGLDLSSPRVSSASTGLATLVTRDGYALTASHVLADAPVTILQLKNPESGQLLLTDAGVVFSPRHSPDKSVRIPPGLLQAAPVRIIRRFPGADLALIRLPLGERASFRPAQGPPSAGTTVFTYGSPLSGHSSAGQILRVSRRATTWKLSSSVPLQKGDSGGPLMTPDGTLLAIVSRGTRSPISSAPHVTIANGIHPGVLARIIARDRANQNSRTPNP
jgi:S1-C subfamily serine protease